VDRGVAAEWPLVKAERHGSAGCPDEVDPSADHADDQDAASNRHCMGICGVTNGPGDSETDWMELMPEV